MIAGITLVDACEALQYLTIRVNRSAKVRFALLFLVVVGWFCGKRHNTVGDFWPTLCGVTRTAARSSLRQFAYKNPDV